MSKSIKSFEDVRNMNDKELSDWLSKIWKTGYNVASIGSPISNCPNFYERLNGKDKEECPCMKEPSLNCGMKCSRCGREL